jgi:glycosyltransferase involved in cell wall biosynthesis
VSKAAKNSNTLIVIPAFNEAANIVAVLNEVSHSTPEFDVLVVDDGSTDNTFDLASEHGVSTLRLPFNLGVGAAMRLGFKYASQNGYKSVVQVDADGQHVPKEIGSLLSKLDRFDVVIGSRFADGASGFVVAGSRRIAMRLLASSLSKITKVKLTDVTSGFRASGPRAIQLFASSYPPEYLGDTIESLVIAHRNGLLVTEVPTTIRQRLTGTSSQSTIKALIYTVRAAFVLLLSLLHRPAESRIGK